MTDEPSDEISNASRAELCHAVLKAYNDADDTIAALTDFLADARHWCDAKELDFAELDRAAYRHYIREQATLPGASS